MDGSNKLKRLSGLYLVVDPSISLSRLLDVTEKALKGGVDSLQLWKPQKTVPEMRHVAEELLNLANNYGVPLIINNDLQLAKEVGADGVHFDGYEVTPQKARNFLNSQCIVGYTVGKDQKWIQWAQTQGADYVSFCSVFASCSAGNKCDIIPLGTIQSAKSATNLPIFASGGITLGNANLVLETGVDGIAVISAILNAADPEQTAKAFKELINKYKK